ncbi:MAG: hypothetical protein DMF81_16740, partial [Acidobacteria bacterium]
MSVRLLVLFLALGLGAPARAAAGAASGSEAPEILVSRGLLRECGLSPGDVVMLSADPHGADARL